MVEDITVGINGGQLKVRNLDILNKRVKAGLIEAEKEFSKQLQLIETDIVRNSTAGRNYNGSSFRAYAPATKEFRRKAGLQVSPPNLTVTGGMLKAISSTTERLPGVQRGKIFIRNQTQRAFKNKGLVNSVEKARRVIKLGFDFFGVSQKNLDKLERAVETAFLKGAKR